MHKLNELIRKPTIPDVIEGLTGTVFYKPLTAALDEYNKTHTLCEIENNLDKVYYANLLSQKIGATLADELFLSFVKREVDFVNLRTLFRLKREGLEHDKIAAYMIPGGAKLSMEELRKLAQTPGYEDFLNGLKETPYWSEIADAVKKSQETGSLNAVEIALRKANIAYADNISHRYPLSITPILGYLIRKNTEVNNLRIIARGKESHLSDEVIRNQLVI
jgi:V/A-type H+-transporting ATPase subunit C